MYFRWKPYIPAAARRQAAERTVAKMVRKGQALSPVTASRGAIAKSFWGKAWCQNLERYSDYSNRLPRGRTYLRNGSVIDLTIGPGEVTAQVMGSSLYLITVSISEVAGVHWQAIARDCARSIDTLVELLQGQLSTSVMERITRPGTGLFPSPTEISFSCSCPDSAAMCKHVAATLYRQDCTAWCANSAWLRGPEKSERLRTPNRVRTAIYAQLDEDALDVRLNRLGRNTDLASNLFI